MTTLTRLVASLACVAGAICPSVLAQTAGAETSPTPLPPDLAAMLASIPKWSVSAAFKGSYGYKDNLLLSATGEESSAFARGSVELFLLRVPQDRFDYSFFVEGERSHYFSATTADKDAKVWARTEPGFRFSETMRVSLPVTGFYYDQVFDFSDTDVERLVAELKVKGAMAGPVVRWDFHPAWWIEAQAVGQRKRYEDGLYDGRSGEGSIRLGWTRGRWLEVRLTAGRRWRDFDDRQQYSATGLELPDTHLKIAEREGELRFDVTLDEAERWQTITRASVLEYRDNGSGYFNYGAKKIAQELEWRNDRWFVRIGGSASRLDFDVQKIGVGVGVRPARIKDEFEAELLVERVWSKRWAVYGGYTWERSRSNDVFASYQVNEGLLGVRWSWEK